MTPNEQRLLAAIRRNPLATQQQLADELGLSRESVAGHIMRLTRQGKILGKGYLLPEQDRIVVVGGANVDLTGTSAGPFRPGDSNPGHLTQCAGGVGRNIAENLARLGHDVTFVTLLGHDANGDWLRDRIQAAGIRTEGLLRHADRPTSSYLAMNDERGQLVGAIADMGIIDDLTPERLGPLQSLLVSATTVVVEANVPKPTLAWLADLPLRGRLYADAVSTAKAPRLTPLLQQLSGLKVNQSEAAALLDEPQADRPALVDRLLAFGLESLALSLGEEGLLLAGLEEQCQRPVYRADVRSDTGAGDALLAGLIHGQLTDRSLDDQAAFALGCAGMTLESDRANHPQLTEPQVLEWIAQR